MGDVPQLACDCHIHVFGPPARFPPAPRRAYTPTEAPFAAWKRIAARLGVRRVVLVQPSAYGTDNACLLDTLRGQPGSARGIAVIDDETPEAALDAMHALGVRGVRLNLVSGGAPGPDEAAALLRRTAARVARLGWHLQLFAEGALLGRLAGTIPGLPVPVVLDHMAGARAAAGGLDQPGLAEALDLLAAGRCWVKLSGAERVSGGRTSFVEALPVMRALAAANPDRLVWGTDWPHIGPHDPAGPPRPATYLPLDESAMLLLLRQAAGDAATFGRILADNPARLYGF